MCIASLFNLYGPDLIIILFIVLIQFGAKKLPDLTRGMGESIRDHLRRKDETERNLGDSVQDSQQRKAGQFSRRTMAASVHLGFAAAVCAPFPLQA